MKAYLIFKEWVKRVLPANSRLRTLLSSIYYHWKPPTEEIAPLLENFAQSSRSVRFLQIGANDGISGDPIHDFVIGQEWTGILVEPVPYLFVQLRKNYANQTGLTFEQIAIGEQDGEQLFYYLEPKNDPHLPHWYQQLGSFKKEVIMQHQALIPQLDAMISELKVPTLTISSLLEKHEAWDVELIHLDTEGYDAAIVLQVPFDQLGKLKLVLFEHCHLSNPEYRSCLNLLKQQGFRVVADDSDTLAINRTRVEGL